MSDRGSFFDLRAAIAILIFVVVCVVFTVLLRPFDYFNLGIFLYSGSYLTTGINPYSVLTQTAPPNLQILSAFSFWIYSLTGFNMPSAVVFYKIANSILIFGCAAVMALIAKNLTGKVSVARNVFVAALFSVPIFFYSMIHLELDVFGLFFTLLGLYILLPCVISGKGSLLRLLSGSVVISYAVYAYIFPLVMIPALIVYSKDTRRRIALLATMTVGLAMFAIPYLSSGTYSLLSSNLAVLTTTPSAYSFSFALEPHGHTPPLYVLEALTAGLAIVTPIVLRKLRIAIMPTMVCVVLAIFLVLPIYAADNFVWPLPFILLALTSLWPSRIKLQHLLLLQLIVLPEIIVFNFYDGLIGMGTGIFYLFYPQFGNPTVIWRYVPNHILVTQLLMLTTFIGLLTIAALSVLKSYCVGKETLRERAIIGRHQLDRPIPKASKAQPRGSFRVLTGNIRKSPLTFTLLALFVATLVTVTIIPITIQTNLSDQNPEFPLGAFLIHPPVNANLTYRVSDDGRTVMAPPTNFFENNGPIAFIRNTTDQTFSFTSNLTTVEPPATLFNTTFLTTTGISAAAVSTTDLGGDVKIMPPTSIYNTSFAPRTEPLWEGATVPVCSLNGSSIANYVIKDPNASMDALLFTHAQSLALSQNLVWRLSFDRTTVELTESLTGWNSEGFGILVSKSSGVWNATYFYPTNNTFWDQTEFSVDNGFLSIRVNNLGVYGEETGNQTLYLSVGRYDLSLPTANHNALIGLASALLFPASGISQGQALQVKIGQDYQVINMTENHVSFTVTSKSDNMTLASSGHLWNVSQPVPVFSLGRLSVSSITLFFTITSLTIDSYVSKSILPVFITLTVVSPGVFGATFLLERRREDRDSRL